MTDETTATRLPAWLESAWLARYLDRQLSADETAWFEAYVLDKPDLLAMVETDNGLRDVLAVDAAGWRPVVNADAMGRSVNHGVAAMDSDRSASISFRNQPIAWLGAVAALVLGVGVGWIGNGVQQIDGGVTVVVNPSRIVVDTLRGGPMMVRMERTEGNAELCIVEIAVPTSAREIEVRLGELPILQSLVPSTDGFVSFIVSRAKLIENADATVSYRLNGAVRTQSILLLVERTQKD